ncbi:MAG: translation initiation factor IF-3 [Parcubacteria group bacterium Gr01-1014_18]|nr:MAG: translation initiation factor IF-3 [Parcubacteria group bacterium Greene0416_36]TSC79879.1 MAG: translation initiation factor IF-3 [Parcubacteria group bacterium Gr01-1014_18]TSC98311.1 MAG: translation initiation factor IF-3 [Parcubacteria group bacterium Greene1014_20]TSD06648.1 MAG: translation initiation factor IF-3 [Parcubacteria group bacterium Greene0714_2]
MRKSYKHRRRPEATIQFKKNQEIRALELRVIDETGKIVGVIPTAEALKMAQERETDLVEVSPKANPPVAKLLDYGKFIYQHEKLMQKQKAKARKVDIKGVRLSMRISDHDLEMKINQAKGFLEKGDKIKIEMNIKGREHQHTGMAMEVINKFIKDLSSAYTLEIESNPMKMAGKITSIISRKEIS